MGEQDNMLMWEDNHKYTEEVKINVTKPLKF